MAYDQEKIEHNIGQFIDLKIELRTGSFELDRLLWPDLLRSPSFSRMSHSFLKISLVGIFYRPASFALRNPNILSAIFGYCQVRFGTGLRNRGFILPPHFLNHIINKKKSQVKITNILKSCTLYNYTYIHFTSWFKILFRLFSLASRTAM